MDFENSQDYKKIFKFSGNTGHKLTSRESGIFEFKESFNWGSKDKYAKACCAFSNNKGGYILFGIKDHPRELVGLSNSNFENVDESNISQYFNNTFSPEILFEKFTVNLRGKTVGVIHINSSVNKPVIAIKNDGDVKEGEIYYRYNARNEKIKFPELKYLLNQIQEKERKQWMELFQKISRIGPMNTALINMAEGTIEGNTGTLVIDHKLIPKLKFIQEGNFKETGSPTLKLIGEVRPISIVGGRSLPQSNNIRITDDPKAIAVREETILVKYPMSYTKLVEVLSFRYSDFKTSKKFFELKKRLVLNKKFCHPRYLDPANVKGTKKDFYSKDIIGEFDKYYTKK